MSEMTVARLAKSLQGGHIQTMKGGRTPPPSSSCASAYCSSEEQASAPILWLLGLENTGYNTTSLGCPDRQSIGC